MQPPLFRAVLLIVSVLLALPSQAATVLDNTGQYTSESGPFGVTTDFSISTAADNQTSFIGAQMIASSFKTGSTAVLQLNSISVLLGTATNINAITSDPLVVSIYSDSTVTGQSYFSNTTGFRALANSTTASHPGTLIGSALTAVTPNPSAPSGTVTTFTWNYAGGLVLSASTTYWIVLSSTDSKGYYDVVADAAITSNPASFTTNNGWSVPIGTTFGDSALYTASGNVDATNRSGANVPANSWMTMPNSPLFFSINATVATAPEPSKALLTLLGCFGLLSRRRRAMAA